MCRRLLTIFCVLIVFFSCEDQKKEEAQQQIPLPDTVRFTLEPTPSPKAKKISAIFNELHRKGFNGNVLIAEKGTVIFKESFGYADFKTKEKLNNNSVFQLASVSKQFTAVAIMKLKEQGLLNYADNVQKFFPDFPYKNITVKDLLTHRSGLANYTYFCDEYCKGKYDPLDNMEVMKLMTDKRPPPWYRPNTRFNYSNTGYCVLGAIVAKVSGMTYEKFVEENIFKPAGMNSSFVYNMKNPVETPNTVKGFGANKKFVPYNYLNAVVGDKGIYSTTEDLYRWHMSLYDETLLKQETLADAFLPYSEIKRSGINYGYGWRTYNWADKKIVFHAGWWQGFKSCFVRVLDDKTCIIILSNVANRGFSFDTIADVIEIIYPEQKQKCQLTSG